MTDIQKIQHSIAMQIQHDLESKGMTKSELTQLMYTGLFEEVGEVAGIFKRRLRQESRDIERAKDPYLCEELGDVLWYLIGLCYALHFDIEDVWYLNQRKLEERYGRRD